MESDASRPHMLDHIIRKTCAGFVVLFGLWTILANVIVQLDLGFNVLRVLAPIVPILALAVLVVYRRLGRRDFPQATPEVHDAPDFSSDWKDYIALAGAGLLAALYAIGLPYNVFWALTLLFLCLFYLRHLKGPEFSLRPPNSGSKEIALFALAASLSVLAALVAHRPDPDDSHFIGMIVSVLDRPDAPMFTYESIRGMVLLPLYRVYSLEPLNALMAYITGWEPITVAHLILPPLFGFLSVCAAAMFFRILLKDTWAWALLALVLVLMAARQTHWMYGNFAFVRMFQGKSVFVTMMVPLIAAYAVEFFLRPRFATWALLALAQVCAVGLTVNALYGAPLAAGLALAGCWRPSRMMTRRLALGLLASFYPLAMGLMLKRQVELIKSRLAAEVLELAGSSSLPLGDALSGVFGHGLTMWLWLAALIGTWALFGDPARRRWMLGVVFIFALVFMNPWLDKLWVTNLTGPDLNWRLFWVLPLPAWLAVLLTSTRKVSFGRRFPLIGFLFFAAALGIFSYIATERFTNVLQGHLEIRTPDLKVPRNAYATTRLLVKLAGQEESVLAPEEISAWVPTFRKHPYPIAARRLYLEKQIALFSASTSRRKEMERRLALLDYVSGKARRPESAALLEKSLREMQIRVVATPGSLKWLPELSKTLKENGFISGRYLDYMVFYRGSRWPADIAPLLSEDRPRHGCEPQILIKERAIDENDGTIQNIIRDKSYEST